ncbi:MAG: Pseudouridine synthase [Gammaproteobacteria bacterium]|nr:Pseudouridine synthase [Gammaproteobacteria bacterium]
MEKLTTIVPENLSGRRLDQVLANLYPQHSRSRLQAWISAGLVKVNNRIRRQKDPVLTGECIEIIPVFSSQEQYLAEAIPLHILYEDEAILIINKPAGLVVHPGAGNPAHTLQNALLYHNASLAQVPRAGIFQRLDKDTSGIMVIAKTPTTHTYLVDQLQRRCIQREYQAIVTGVMTAGGTVAAPIGRHPTLRKRMTVLENGKPAVTHYRVLKKYPQHTHISVRLETGRTHQIRVHMAYIHYPVVGDPVYGGRKRVPKNITPELRQAILAFPRQALHASALTLAHPISKKEMSWSAPLPADFQSLLTILADNVSARE